MGKSYHQTKNDREDESLGMRRGKESSKKQSFKDRRDESYGSTRDKKDDSNMKNKKYGSSNHGGMDESKRIRPEYVAQRQKDWGDGASDSMRQDPNSSFDYLSKKDAIVRKDEKVLSREMLPQ